MVSLYLAADERAKAAKLLKEAVSTSQKLTKSEDMKLVWRKTAEFHLKGDEPSVAAKSLEELLKANPNDKTTLAQLVLAYAKFDMKKALETCKKLPDFATRDVDVDALEATATMSRYVKFGFLHFFAKLLPYLMIFQSSTCLHSTQYSLESFKNPKSEFSVLPTYLN